MDWPRLLEIIALATLRVRVGHPKDRGYQWVCYCRVCAELRRLIHS